MKPGLHFYSSFFLIFNIYCFTFFLFEEVFSIENTSKEHQNLVFYKLLLLFYKFYLHIKKYI
jgi:hypothetical protein